MHGLQEYLRQIGVCLTFRPPIYANKTRSQDGADGAMATLDIRGPATIELLGGTLLGGGNTDWAEQHIRG